VYRLRYDVYPHRQVEVEDPMHEETHAAIARFIKLVKKHHPEDVAELTTLLTWPTSDGPPDDEWIEPKPDREPEDWEIHATFPPESSGCFQPAVETCRLTPAVLELSKRRTLSFGKYGPKNSDGAHTVHEVYLKDPSYLRWVLENVDRLDFDMRQVITAVVGSTPSIPNAKTKDSDPVPTGLPAGWGQPA